MDPGYEEDLDIFIELKEAVFYQASYGDTEVAIIADYPGLLPSSHVSTQETSPPKEFLNCTSPTTMSHARKGRRSSRRAASKASSKKAMHA